MPKLSTRGEQGTITLKQGGDTMSQRTISAVYSLYRSYIEQGKYDLAKTTYERYLDTIPVNMLEVAIYDYIVG